MKLSKMLIPLWLLLTWLAGCTQQQEQTRGLEQIHNEDGLPVKVTILQTAPFSTWMLFNATLQGVEQSVASAPLGARVVSVLASVGERVEKDQVIVTFPTDHPQAFYAQARIAYKNAASALERLEDLFDNGGIAQQELDNVRLQYDLASVNWDIARRNVAVRAPISGCITSILVRPTDNVPSEDPLFTVARTDSMRCRLWLSEQEFLNVQVGSLASLSWQDETFTGILVQLDQAVDRRTGGFGAILHFANRNNLLKPGVTAEVYLQTYHNPEALTVAFPNLIGNDISGRSVYLAQGDQAVLQPVETGRRQGLQVEITSGLSVGDQLIVTGQQMLEEGTHIRILEREE